MKRAASHTFKLVAVLLMSALLFYVFKTFEEVAARRIVKSCHQNKVFTVGDEAFSCRLVLP
jgi:hypothetical protein